MKKECIAMLLAGGQGSRLYALTRDNAKPGLSFGGKYRIIDFPLSNCANSGIDTVGVLTQYKPLQLNSYIGPGTAWDLDSSEGGTFILPPYQTAGDRGQWFRGTADAIYQNMDFVDSFDPEYVLILSGDHIYKMDYADMLATHKRNRADCTIAVLRVPMADASRFGIMTLDDTGAICRFTEKPKQPDSDLASMGIYIFTLENAAPLPRRGRGGPGVRKRLRQEHHPGDARRRRAAVPLSFRGLLARRRHHRQLLGCEYGPALAEPAGPL